VVERRYGIAWGVLVAAEDSIACALRFAEDRVVFGRPVAGYQLAQAKLAHMVTELTKGQLLALRLGRLKERARTRGEALDPAQVSMAKMNNVKTALDVARACRDILGANGIMEDYPPMRHLCNLETVSTYEGTHDVHVLVIGAALTGRSAFRG
jgi:glutaryl-CoA dehydrogenase